MKKRNEPCTMNRHTHTRPQVVAWDAKTGLYTLRFGCKVCRAVGHLDQDIGFELDGIGWELDGVFLPDLPSGNDAPASSF